MRAVSMLDLVRCCGLAAACLFGPVLLIYCGTDFAVGLLVRQERTEQLPGGLAYKLLDTKDSEGRLVVPPGSSKPAEKSEDEKRAETDLKRTDLYARHIAGRYNFSVGVGFVFF